MGDMSNFAAWRWAWVVPRSLTGLLLMVALLTAGCFGSVADVHHRHFMLDAEGDHAKQPPATALGAKSSTAAPPSLWVRDLQVGAVYDRAQWVRRRGPHEVTFSRNEVWAARIGRMLGDAAAHQWLRSGLFLAVNRTATEVPAQYTLVGEVMALEVLEPSAAAKLAQAHLSWVLQLVETASGAVVAQQLFDGSQAVGATAADAFDSEAAAAAFNVLVRRALQQGAQALAEGFGAAKWAPDAHRLPQEPELLQQPKN